MQSFVISILLCSCSRQEQSSALVELMKDYHSLKSSINSVLESAEAITDIKAALKDQEDTRRSLMKV